MSFVYILSESGPGMTRHVTVIEENWKQQWGEKIKNTTPPPVVNICIGLKAQYPQIQSEQPQLLFINIEYEYKSCDTIQTLYIWDLGRSYIGKSIKITIVGRIKCRCKKKMLIILIIILSFFLCRENLVKKKATLAVCVNYILQSISLFFNSIQQTILREASFCHLNTFKF